MKIVIALLLIKTITLSFDHKENNPASLFPYYTAASDDLPLGHLSNPSYLPLYNAEYINTAYSKPYSMRGIDSGNFRIGYSNNDFAVQGAWTRFGIDVYSEDIVEGSAGYRPCEFISIGAGVSYNYLKINTEELSFKYGIYDVKFSALLSPYKWLRVCYLQENIFSLFNEDREDLLFPDRSFGVTLKPAAGISLVWNITENYYGYINSFSFSANLLSVLNLKGGYSRETSTYSAAVNILYNKFFVSYGLSYHSYLGSTHKIGITISTTDISVEQVNYNKMLKREYFPKINKKININKCTPQELLDSQIFTPEMAERIIKYREVIGEISEKALFQIGMSQAEIDSAEKYFTGAAPDHEIIENNIKKYDWEGNANRRHSFDKRKQIFKKLLDNGFSALTSLKITEMAKNKSKEELFREITNMTDISKDKKRIIKRICDEIL